MSWPLLTGPASIPFGVDGCPWNASILADMVTEPLNGQRLLSIRGLSVSFESNGAAVSVVSAVDGVSLDVPRGRTVALVGESGCGKSVTALSILRLLPQPPARIDRGSILLYDDDREPLDLLKLSERGMRAVRGRRVAMIFQDPLTALNPVYSVGKQIAEAVELHQSVGRRAAWSAAVELLAAVGISAPRERARAYPHQLSGGMRQRVMIAMALSCRPDVLIADEPTTALDVTIQAQILDLLRQAQADRGMGVLFITHDLGVVAQLAHDVYIMYAGRIVEHAAVAELFTNPLHPYTRALLACLPERSQTGEPLAAIPGAVAAPGEAVGGCRFHPRCVMSAERALACHAVPAVNDDWPTQEDATSSHGHAGTEAGGNAPGGLAGSLASERATVAGNWHAGSRVLRRCVEAYEGEPSGVPKLEEKRPGHFVACWEVPAAALPQKSPSPRQ